MISTASTRVRLFPTAFLLLALSACGGGGGGGGGSSSADPVDRALNDLGVSTAPSSRQVETGIDVPAGYSPLGASWRASTKELLVLGAHTATGVGLSITDLTDDNGNAATTALVAKQETALPFPAEARNNVAPPQTLRAATAADFDGDGHEEAVVVYQTTAQTRVYIVDDTDAGHAVLDTDLQQIGNVTNVACAAGDFDGDGDDDLAVGLTHNGQGELTFFQWNGTGFVRMGPMLTLQPSISTATLAMKITTGNLDYDRGVEVAVVVNERIGTFSATGTTRYAVFDDAAAEFAQLATGAVTAITTAGTFTAVTASIAIGDIDGDTLGEVVVGGPTALADACGSQARHAVLALDDKVRAFATIAATNFTDSYSGCSNEVARLYTAHVRTLDLDGDGVQEIVVNRHVFDDFANAAPWTDVLAWRLPQTILHPSNSGDLYDDSTSSMVIGDFTGDNRDDIACYCQMDSTVRVYGLTATATTVAQLRSLTAQSSGWQTQVNPILVGVDVATDGPVLKYADAEYQLVFSEPVVLAALAAAPYRDGIGQNVGDCFTAFGNTQSTGSATDRSVSFHVASTVGFQADFGPLTQSAIELKATVDREATRTRGSAYTLSKTILFHAAPSEDTVVFTSVPIDRYVYTVVSHPDPTLVGTKVVVDMPREPVTRRAERTFFNRTVPAGRLQIGTEVFAHTIGEPSTYPTRALKNSLLAFYDGLDVGPIGVPQGGGSTPLSLDVSQEMTTGGALAVSYDIDLEATAGGQLRGLSIGTSASSSWQISSGTSTTFVGQVGGIPAGVFAQNQYQWGLFSYVYQATNGAQFQVVGYWVE